MPAQIDLERLYDEHAQALFGLLLNLTRNEADTRDLLQEVFVKLAQRPGLLSEVRDERSFLLRLSHNMAIDLMRRKNVRQKHYDQIASESFELFASDAEPDERDFRRALSLALGALPIEQRAVAHLKLWERLTFEQIASLLEIPANTAASRYRYALDKLRERLRPIYDEIK